MHSYFMSIWAPMAASAAQHVAGVVERALSRIEELLQLLRACRNPHKRSSQRERSRSPAVSEWFLVEELSEETEAAS